MFILVTTIISGENDRPPVCQSKANTIKDTPGQINKFLKKFKKKQKKNKQTLICFFNKIVKQNVTLYNN